MSLSEPPRGLSSDVQEFLKQAVVWAETRTRDELLEAARNHLQQAREAAGRNAFINVRLAEAVCDRLHVVATHWEQMPEPARPWLKGAMAYFALSVDDVPDLDSTIGFEDDCEVLSCGSGR